MSWRSTLRSFNGSFETHMDELAIDIGHTWMSWRSA
jgi:hypothetical protein